MIQEPLLPSAILDDVKTKLGALPLTDFEMHDFVGDFFNEDVFDKLAARVDIRPVFLVDVESTQEVPSRRSTGLRALSDAAVVVIYACTSGARSSTLMDTGRGQITSADAAHSTLYALQGTQPDLAAEPFDVAQYEYTYQSMEREMVGGDVSVHSIRYTIQVSIDVDTYFSGA